MEICCFLAYNSAQVLLYYNYWGGLCDMSDPTAVFSIYDEREREIHAVVQEVYDALKEKGYNPINQLVGYILSEDPTYITTYKNARALIRRIDRDDILQAMVRNYVDL